MLCSSNDGRRACSSTNAGAMYLYRTMQDKSCGYLLWRYAPCRVLAGRAISATANFSISYSLFPPQLHPQRRNGDENRVLIRIGNAVRRSYLKPQMLGSIGGYDVIAVLVP